MRWCASRLSLGSPGRAPDGARPPAAAACCRARVDAPVPDDGVLASSACVRLGRLRGGSDWRGWWYKTLAKFGIFLKKVEETQLRLDHHSPPPLLQAFDDDLLEESLWVARGRQRKKRAS